MFRWLIDWLTQSERIHLKGDPASSMTELVSLLDRFVDGNLRYGLEWDDFISWDHDNPGIEAIRYRIAVLEPLFFSEDVADREEAMRVLIAERDSAAALCGLPPRPTQLTTETRSITAKFDFIIDRVAAAVASHGFVRRRATIKKRLDKRVALVEFQKSIESDRHHIVFTINLAVIHEQLREDSLQPLSKLSAMHGQLRERIGFLMPEADDKWWQIDADTDELKLADEISSIVRDSGTPYVDRYLDLGELIALWAAGESPGLTDIQRIRHLKRALEL